jgi:hypothetical protein
MRKCFDGEKDDKKWFPFNQQLAPVHEQREKV